MNKQIKFLQNAKVEKKEEAQGKNGTYFKFTINGIKMSCWDANMGKEVPVGSIVNVQYTETPGVNGVIYKNISAIFDASISNNVEVEEVSMNEYNSNESAELPFKKETSRKLQTATSEDGLFNVCAGEALNIVGRIYDTHYVKHADVPVKFDSNWINAYGDTLINVYEKALQIRKEKLGY